MATKEMFIGSEGSALNQNFYTFIINELDATIPLSINGKAFMYLNDSAYKQVFSVGEYFIYAMFNKNSISFKLPSHSPRHADNLAFFSEFIVALEDKPKGEKLIRFLQQHPSYLNEDSKVIFVQQVSYDQVELLKRALKNYLSIA